MVCDKYLNKTIILKTWVLAGDSTKGHSDRTLSSIFLKYIK